MPSLILLNGPPAAGKSTLARMYAADHPLALNLDIDWLRAQLGRWQDDPGRAGLAARRIALAAARAQLAAGYDVVVPQLVARLEFIEQLEAAALESGAAFREVLLLDDAASLRARYRDRAHDHIAAGRSDPVISVDQTDTELTDWYQKLLAAVAGRPATIVIEVRTGEAAAAYRELVARLR